MASTNVEADQREEQVLGAVGAPKKTKQISYVVVMSVNLSTIDSYSKRTNEPYQFGKQDNVTTDSSWVVCWSCFHTSVPMPLQR